MFRAILSFMFSACWKFKALDLLSQDFLSAEVSLSASSCAFSISVFTHPHSPGVAYFTSPSHFTANRSRSLIIRRWKVSIAEENQLCLFPNETCTTIRNNFLICPLLDWNNQLSTLLDRRSFSSEMRRERLTFQNITHVQLLSAYKVSG